MSRDVIQELVDAAFPTGGTTEPNAWTDERIRERTRFAENCERILADYEAAVEALERLVNVLGPASILWTDPVPPDSEWALTDARAALARLREEVPA